MTRPPDPPAIRPAPLSLFLLAGGIAASFLLFAHHVYPVPTSDSYSFLPPALLLEAGRGLRNPLSELARSLDPQGARYLQYPPLFQGALALLMGSATARAAWLALAAINVANVLLTALLLARVARRDGIAAPARTPLLWASLLGAATALLGAQAGRPEVLATTWALLSAHLHLLLPPERAWPAAGLLLGLMAATHPMGALLLGLLTVALYAVRLPLLPALARSAGTLGTGLALFAAVLAAGPFGLADSLAGMFHHATLVFGRRPSGGDLKTYWITNPGATFYALPYLWLPAALAWRAALGRGVPVRSPRLLAAALLPVLAITWSAGVRTPELVYNLLLFAPLVFAGIVHLASGSRRLSGAAAVAHGASAIGYLRAVVLFGFFLYQGVPLDEARAGLRRTWTEGELVAVTPSLWVAAEEYDRMIVFPFGAGEAPPRGDVAMVQQNYSGRIEPPDLPGFALIEDRFVHRRCEIFGVPLARTTPGYGFALYRRLAPEPMARPAAVASRPAGPV